MAVASPNGARTPPPDETLPLSEASSRAYNTVEGFLSEDAPSPSLRKLQTQVRVSVRVIRDALDRYSLDELAFSYNGGKDCLVLLILYLHALHLKSLETSLTPTKHNPPYSSAPTRTRTLQSVYIQSASPFLEVEEFVDRSAKTYSLSVQRYVKPMKAGLEDYLRDYPHVRAIFVGTRRADPYAGNLTHFDPTDRDWPTFMRIHPIIDWAYVDIWAFLRHLQVPYCSLYDNGYTSLGGIHDTMPNPVLRETTVDVDGNVAKFRPAYELQREEEERLGRIRRDPPLQ